ncbi:MAG: rRNA maturation RNase YbeY [Bacteriovoracaceae bacterium]|nr:rRNA maturation RNase YbeY [Bacteriovoracaceae bacterium]
MPKLTVETFASVKFPLKAQRWLELAFEVASSELPSKIKVAQLSLVICGDQRMRSTNKIHRKKDKTTDVLSFPHQENLRDNKNPDFIADQVISIGDLMISFPQAVKQAKKFKVSTEEELVHLFFHGFLHLMGFDHEISQKEEKIMELKERVLLERFAKLRQKKKLK